MAEESGELNDKIMKDEEKVEEKNSLERRIDNRIAEFDSEANGSGENTPDSAREIREQIEETRSQMSETIDAIQDKLSIANITEQVKDQVSEQIGGAFENVKDAFYGRTIALSESVGRGLAQLGKSDTVKKVRENPWIISIGGMGIGVILVVALFGDEKNERRKNSRRSEDFDERLGFEKDYTKLTRQKFDSDASDFSGYQSERSEHKAAHFADESEGGNDEESRSKASRVADSAYQSIGSAAVKTYDSIGKASNLTYEKAGDLGGEVMKNYSYYIKENPLAVGAVVLAVGAAIGYAIPLTEVENNFLGEMRDNVV
ncbi:MAG: DUF3618 domain-containing protein, partial [Acidobacteriota bacterium]|nr:DUF3618 domain-containing protein [Acidobacteriota bacterium]